MHGFLKGLEDDGWHIIHLRRLNPVRTVVSFIHAARNGFQVMANEEPRPYEPMVLSAEELSPGFQLPVRGWRLSETRYGELWHAS